MHQQQQHEAEEDDEEEIERKQKVKGMHHRREGCRSCAVIGFALLLCVRVHVSMRVRVSVCMSMSKCIKCVCVCVCVDGDRDCYVCSALLKWLLIHSILCNQINKMTPLGIYLASTSPTCAKRLLKYLKLLLSFSFFK